MKKLMQKLGKLLPFIGAVMLLLPSSAWATDLALTNADLTIYSLMTVAVVMFLAVVLVALVLYGAFYLKLKQK